MLEIHAAVWTASLDELRRHGAGRLECVVYWIGPAGTNVVDEVVHPDHLAYAGYFEIKSDWFQRLWVDLDRRGRSVLAQVHTHGGRAFHSQTDDEGAIVQVPGFISVVLPRFALGVQSPEDGYVARLSAAGKFVKSTARAELRVVR